MKYGLGHTLSRLAAGETLTRIMMNVALSEEVLAGRVVDVGGGRKPNYFNYLQTKEGSSVEMIDGSSTQIDFEKDSLPYPDGSLNTVISCNVLEHIYNYAHLVKEMRRITAPNGSLVGFVPFWMGYHPDPHDYFRYTDEALNKILIEGGYSRCRVRSIGGGPFRANFNTIVLSVPRFLRPILYIPYMVLDSVLLFLRPTSRQRNPLGFVFVAYA